VDAHRNTHWIWRLIENTPFGEKLICWQARRQVLRQTHGQYPAPLTALEVVNRTFLHAMRSGLDVEAHEFGRIAATPGAHNLIRLFQVDQNLKRDGGIDGTYISPTIAHTAVIGAGLMGGGIAWLFAKNDISVRLKDLNWDAICAAYRHAQELNDFRVRTRRLTAREADLRRHRLTGTTDYRGFGKLDFVIEAVVESPEIKRGVYAELEQHMRRDAIIATNTSTLDINDLCRDMQHPERFIGMHFFNPVDRMPLVEVIPSEKTAPWVVAATVAYAKRLGKTPIVVQSKPGFLVNRILLPYLCEAVELLIEGAPMEIVDKALLDFGMPMGPITLLDEVGLDVALKAGRHLVDAFPERMRMPALLPTMVQDHRLLGRKGGAGFYLYQGKEKIINPLVGKLLAEIRETRGMSAYPVPQAEIVDRCLYLMVNEATRCLEDGIVANADYLDMAMITGTGFPAIRGGLLRYADDTGLNRVLDRLEEFKQTLGCRFDAAPRLRDLCDTLGSFTGGSRHETH